MIDAYLDTNVILRYVTEDQPDQQAAAAALFEQVEAGRLTLTAPESVVADAVFVLSSPALYDLPRASVRDLLLPVLLLPHLRLKNKPCLLRALDLYVEHRVDFSDALLVAWMETEEPRGLYSFDRDFDRFAGIERLQPGH